MSDVYDHIVRLYSDVLPLWYVQASSKISSPSWVLSSHGSCRLYKVSQPNCVGSFALFFNAALILITSYLSVFFFLQICYCSARPSFS